MRSADVASDHYLVRSTIRLKPKRAPATTSTTKGFDTQKLQNHDIHRRFTIQLKNRFQALAVEEQMTDKGDGTRRPSGKKKRDNGESLCQNRRGGTRVQEKEKRAMVQSGGLDFGRPKENHVKQKLIGARSERPKQRWQNEYRQKDREVKTQVRVDKRKWTEEIVKEAENAAEQKHMKTLYTLTKVLSNERPRQSAAKQARSLTIKKVSSDDGWSTSLKY